MKSPHPPHTAPSLLPFPSHPRLTPNSSPTNPLIPLNLQRRPPARPAGAGNPSLFNSMLRHPGTPSNLLVPLTSRQSLATSHPLLTPLSATLTAERRVLTEIGRNRRPLTSLFPILTRTRFRKSFVSHTYENPPGVGLRVFISVFQCVSIFRVSAGLGSSDHRVVGFPATARSLCQPLKTSSMKASIHTHGFSL